jgi:hypothetical protein
VKIFVYIFRRMMLRSGCDAQQAGESVSDGIPVAVGLLVEPLSGLDAQLVAQRPRPPVGPEGATSCHNT